jgi:hypothetical protein
VTSVIVGLVTAPGAIVAHSNLLSALTSASASRSIPLSRMSEDQDQVPNEKSARRTSGTAWAIAFAMVGITAIAAITFMFRECSPAHLAQIASSGLAQAFQPRVNVNTVIYTTLSNMVSQSKLVVLNTHINVDLTKSNEKVIWGVPLGTTTVKVRALDNIVQYYVPLTNISKADFKYDDVHKRLTLRVPAPRLDEDLVEVQSDPGKIEFRTDVGWARLDSRSGQFLREQAQKELRPAIVREGNSSIYIDKAKTNAKESLKKLLEPMATRLKEDVELELEFK